VHGVMNTDNMTISGETIDYGPCAFMEAFDPRTVFSSIDHGGRYAYGNQPQVAHWNLARFAETLLPLIADEQQAAIDAATEVLGRFPSAFERTWRRGMLAKLGLREEGLTDEALVEDALGLLADQGVDYTSFFRSLSGVLRGEEDGRALFAEIEAFDRWAERWRAELEAQGASAAEVAEQLDRVNPAYIPRNQLVEEALAAATAGDLGPYEELVEVVTRPFDEQPGRGRYAEPAGAGCGPYVTFCGT
jgi:serine/tyrosine/threonine adenylyltransferase